VQAKGLQSRRTRRKKGRRKGEEREHCEEFTERRSGKDQGEYWAGSVQEA
jgi:hypothetical protein